MGEGEIRAYLGEKGGSGLKTLYYHVAEWFTLGAKELRDNYREFKETFRTRIKELRKGERHEKFD